MWPCTYTFFPQQEQYNCAIVDKEKQIKLHILQYKNKIISMEKSVPLCMIWCFSLRYARPLKTCKKEKEKKEKLHN